MRQNNKIRSVFVFLFFSLLGIRDFSFSQGTWTQKADFGGAGRMYAVGFSIGTKGYIGTGNNFSPLYDLWEWEQASNTWTQKASITWPISSYAAGFSIGTKGYIGTGWGNGNILIEWDQGTNTWVQKANFGGAGRIHAAGFSIGTKGYIGMGATATFPNDTLFNDFWEWDGDTASPTYNTWLQKANFGGTARKDAVGFSIGTKGYFGTGADADSARSDFWEWDGDTASPTYNTWLQKANFGGPARARAAVFSIGAKGYVGTGNTCPFTGGCTQTDFWEWDQVSNTWMQKANLGGLVREGAVGFAIGNKGYIGTGRPGASYERDFWEYCDTCTVGLNELDNEISISIYPNPTAGKIMVSSNSHINAVEIFNVQGEKVYSTSQTSNEIDLSEHPAGIYFVKVKTDEGILTKKMIIQR